ncbi:hypothetical protein ACJX0J_022138, partial [Zea mays]
YFLAKDLFLYQIYVDDIIFGGGEMASATLTSNLGRSSDVRGWLMAPVGFGVDMSVPDCGTKLARTALVHTCVVIFAYEFVQAFILVIFDGQYELNLMNVIMILMLKLSKLRIALV